MNVKTGCTDERGAEALEFVHISVSIHFISLSSHLEITIDISVSVLHFCYLKYIRSLLRSLKNDHDKFYNLYTQVNSLDE